jgi:hypothetical protein
MLRRYASVSGIGVIAPRQGDFLVLSAGALVQW